MFAIVAIILCNLRNDSVTFDFVVDNATYRTSLERLQKIGDSPSPLKMTSAEVTSSPSELQFEEQLARERGRATRSSSTIDPFSRPTKTSSFLTYLPSGRVRQENDRRKQKLFWKNKENDKLRTTEASFSRTSSPFIPKSTAADDRKTQQAGTLNDGVSASPQAQESDGYRLYSYLSNPKRYNKNVRPVRSTSSPVNVHMEISLREIMGLDEDNGKASVRIWERLEWRDDFLQWEPSKYGNIMRTHFDFDAIWTPDIALYNSVDTKIERDMKLTVLNNGDVKLVLPAVYKVTCKHELRGNLWSCPLRFGSWVYDQKELDLQPFNTRSGKQGWGLTANNYSSSDYWLLIDTEGHRTTHRVDGCPEPFVMFEYKIRMRGIIGPSLINGRRRRKK